MRFTCFFILLMTLLACSGEKASLEDIREYQGPIIEVDSSKTIYSDSAIIKLRIFALKQLEYENGDREFPRGVYIEFFENGLITSTLQANAGYYIKEEDRYTGLDDVVVINQKEQQKLNTEELNWLPQEKRIYTDKFVRIEREGEVLLGEGLTASEDLSTYEILQPRGEFEVEEEQQDFNIREPQPLDTIRPRPAPQLIKVDETR